MSRACAGKWVNRRRLHGDAGLQDRPSSPHRSPNATPAWVIAQIESWRREHKWSAQRITDELVSIGFVIDRRTVRRHLTRLGPGELRFIDPGGENNRKPGKIIARRDSDQAKVAGRAKSAGAKRGYVCLHSVVDGFSRLAYTEPLGDEKGARAAAFLARAKVWFAAHGINHIHRVVTGNGACYRSGDFAPIVGQGTRHQRTKPYTPRHNGKVERYQRIMAEEVLYAREFTSEDARSATITVWNIHYNYHRPHSAAAGKPPAARLRESRVAVTTRRDPADVRPRAQKVPSAWTDRTPRQGSPSQPKRRSQSPRIRSHSNPSRQLPSRKIEE